MENGMEHIDQMAENDLSHLPPSYDEDSLASSQRQHGVQKRQHIFRTRKGVLFLVLALLLIIASLSASLLAFHVFARSGPTRQWTYQLGDQSFDDSSPIVANGMVYVLSQKFGDIYTLFALNEHSGNKEWSYQVRGFIANPLVIANRVIYVVSDDLSAETSIVYALDAVSGRAKWIYQTADGTGGSDATVANGLFYLLSRDGTLSAFNAISGHQEWAANLGDYAVTSPVVANGFVYAAVENDTEKSYSLYALDASSGHEKWSDREASLTFQPRVADGTVYVISDDVTAGTGTAYALDAVSGHRKWSRQIDQVVTGQLAVISDIVEVANGVVYVDAMSIYDTDNVTLYALDSLSGRQLWSRQSLRYGLTITNGVAYAFSGTDNSAAANAPALSLLALDARSGHVKWSHQIDAITNMADIPALGPLVVNGVVYVGAADNNLHALDARSGRELWAYQMDLWLSGVPSPVIAHGLLYVVSSDGDVSAIQLPGKAA